MQQSWPARYFDGVTAQPETVTVTPGAHGLDIRRRENGVIVWRYNEARQTQGHYAGEQVRLERGVNPVEALVVDDPAFLSRLHKVAPRMSRGFHDPSSRARRPMWVGAALAAAILLGAGIYFWGIPGVAVLAAERVPVSWEEELGESVVKAMVGSAPECEHPGVKRAIDDIVKRLAATVPNNPYQLQVTVVRRDVMNAFAVPGGRIVVFSGLLDRTDRPEELAGVLAHEMSHVLKRHGTKSMFRDMSTSIFISAVLGDVSGASATVLQGARTLGNLHYSRQAEEEADSEGLKMLLMASIDPCGLASFFEKLEKPAKSTAHEKDILKYLSTHPLTGDRIAKIKAEQAARKPFVALVGATSWKTLAKACDPSSKESE
jgi:Zn-dependent protease with chaperone function